MTCYYTKCCEKYCADLFFCAGDVTTVQHPDKPEPAREPVAGEPELGRGGGDDTRGHGHPGPQADAGRPQTEGVRLPAQVSRGGGQVLHLSALSAALDTEIEINLVFLIKGEQ